MNCSIIFHSYSGKTRSVAEQIRRVCEGTMIEVAPRHPYTSLSVVPMGCFRALRGVGDPVLPEIIDVSGSDLIIIASPVWAGRPSPVINGAIHALTGFEGKRAFIIVTCGDEKSGKQALVSFRKSVEEKGIAVAGMAVLDKNHVDDEASLSDLVSDIRGAAGGA